MLDPSHPLAELLRRDDRYKFDSYVFVFDALRFAQEKLNMGRVMTPNSPSDAADELDGEEEFDVNLEGEFDEDFDDEFDEDFENGLDEFASEEFSAGSEEVAAGRQRHVSGQELCEAIRCYALDQYGLLAKSVLNEWGVRSTGDFGEIVFNLIDIGQMRKTDSDCREDFNDVYDFERGFSDAASYWQQQKPSGDDDSSSQKNSPDGDQGE